MVVCCFVFSRGPAPLQVPPGHPRVRLFTILCTGRPARKSSINHHKSIEAVPRVSGGILAKGPFSLHGLGWRGSGDGGGTPSLSLSETLQDQVASNYSVWPRDLIQNSLGWEPNLVASTIMPYQSCPHFRYYCIGIEERKTKSLDLLFIFL